MPQHFLIYGLIDPRNGQLRYVGKSCSGLGRPRQHERLWSLRKDGSTRKANWLRQLLAAGLKPEVEVLETCDSAEALSETEQFHIAYWRMVGADLTNLTAGGDGTVGYRHTDNAKARTGASSKGRRHSTEARQRIAASLSGRPRPPEVGARISLAMRGNKRCVGRVVSDETRQKMSASNKAARKKGRNNVAQR